MSNTAFDCVACGACCFSKHPRYLVLLPEDRDRKLPPESLFQEGERSFVDFSCGHCTHLKLETGQAICAVYEERPEACRWRRKLGGRGPVPVVPMRWVDGGVPLADRAHLGGRAWSGCRAA